MSKLQKVVTIHQIPIDTPGVYVIAHTMFECLENKPFYHKEDEDGDYRAHGSSELLLFSYKELDSGPQKPRIEKPQSKKRRKHQIDELKDQVPQAKLYVISCDAIESECVAVPDIDNKLHHGYFIVRSRSSWRDIIFQKMNE